MSEAKAFSNTFRYIDDLLTLNNPSFKNVINESELVLKKNAMVSYLDVIKDGHFTTTVYDNRDSFNLSSNIPTGHLYISVSENWANLHTYDEFIKRNMMITTLCAYIMSWLAGSTFFM